MYVRIYKNTYSGVLWFTNGVLSFSNNNKKLNKYLFSLFLNLKIQDSHQDCDMVYEQSGSLPALHRRRPASFRTFIFVYCGDRGIDHHSQNDYISYSIGCTSTQ